MSSVKRLANNNGNPTVCGIYQDKLHHLARQSNLASPEFPVINPRFLFNSLGVFSEFLEFTRTRWTQPFNYNSCVTKFKTKLQKVTQTIMKPKVPCIMLSFLSGGMSPNYRAVSVGTAIKLIKGEERTDRHVYLFIIW